MPARTVSNGISNSKFKENREIARWTTTSPPSGPAGRPRFYGIGVSGDYPSIPDEVNEGPKARMLRLGTRRYVNHVRPCMPSARRAPTFGAGLAARN